MKIPITYLKFQNRQCVYLCFAARIGLITLIIMLAFPLCVVSTSIVDCSSDYECRRDQIHCTSDCIVLCSGSNSCYGSTITIDGNSSLTLQCSGEESCDGSTITAGEHSSLTLQCSAYWSCIGSSITVDGGSSLDIQCSEESSCPYSSITVDGNSSLDIQCSGYRSCTSSSITFDRDSSLTLQCTGDTSCYNTAVNASSNTNLNITCYDCTSSITVGSHSTLYMVCTNDSRSCYQSDISVGVNSTVDVSCESSSSCQDMSIDGQNAASLAIHDCSEYGSCLGMEIWCPEKTANGERRCILEGGDELGGDSWGEMVLYAVNSWDEL